MFRILPRYRSAYTSLAALTLLGAAAASAQPIAADPAADGAGLDLSLVAARSVCTKVTISSPTAQPESGVLRTAAAEAPKKLEHSRASCVTQRILRVARPTIDASAPPAMMQTIGFIRISERRSIDRIEGLDLSSAPDRTAKAGFQLADYRAPALPRSPVAATRERPQESSYLFPRDPREHSAGPALPPPSAFDYVATPREVSFTPPPGEEDRFDPKKANGDLRKGLRWLTRLITGEED